MTPITLVTGFLGAGKTTLLSRVLRDPQGLSFAVLVNDFGSVNIDADLLRESGEEILALENGCICCSLSQGLLATVRSVLRRRDPPDRILIEASGVSDPYEIADTLADEALAAYAPLDGVVAVVDAQAPPDAVALPLARRQVGKAGLVLLNKVDLAHDGGDAAGAWVRSVAADVPIVATRQADVPLPALLGVGASGAGTTGGFAAHAFESATVRTPIPLRLARLHALLGALPRGVVRAKGLLNLAEKPGHRCVLQVAGGHATLTVGSPWGDEQAETRLVFIGVPGSVDAAWIGAQLGATPP